MVQAQLAWYNEMERQGELRMIKTADDLKDHLSQWNNVEGYSKIGFLLTLEGADSIVTFEHLEILHKSGLRAIGPAHYGPGTYAYGTNSDGSIGENGKQLLQKMETMGLALDATHLCDRSFWEAMDVFHGTLWASHNNCRSLVDHNRQFSDAQIKVLIERDAVIGLALDAWMMVPNWQKRISNPQNTSVLLDHMIDHMEHICNIAGNTDHIAIGTDLDGGFGKEQSPSDIDTIADLQKLTRLLDKRGFSEYDIDAIFHKNWLRKLNELLT
jgi:membrane dipeptidase